MGFTDYISSKEQIRILQHAKSSKGIMDKELWSRYASLATAFRISKEITCLDSNKNCFAASIDRFCRYRADYGYQTWQSCVSALVKFVTKPLHKKTQKLKPQKDTTKNTADTKYQGSFIIKFEAEESSHLWVAKAMEQTTYHILSGFDRLIPREAPKEFDDACYAHKCQMQWLKENKIDIFLKGRVVYDKLIVEVYDIFDQYKINESTYSIIPGKDLSSFKINMFQLVRPFTRHGGILDRIEARKNLMFLEEKILITPNDIINFLEITDTNLIEFVEIIFKSYPLIGGILWGIFLVYMFKFTFPKIYRFENMVSRVMPSLLKSWLVISTWRATLIFLAFFPVVLILTAIKFYWQLPDLFFWTLLFPLCLCIALILWIIILEISTYLRDSKIVLGKVNDSNIYHKAITNYLNDYLRRNDKQIVPRLIKNALFLAQKNSNIETYGGIISKARIVIDIRLIELALGDIDKNNLDDQEDKKREIPVAFEEEEKDDADDTDKPEDLRVKSDKKLHSKYMKWETFKSLRSFKQFEVTAKGEKGLAIHDDDLPPEKVVDDEDDIDPDFIRKMDLKTEDYRDFLYGVLISELGSVYTRHSIFRLITGYSSRSSENLPKFLQRFRKYIQRIYQRNYSRFPQLINDSLISPFKGIPHMFQFLSYRITDDKGLLTQNASRQELWELSNDILNAIQSGDNTEEDNYYNNATWKNRIIWLSHHIYPKEKIRRKYSLTIKLLQTMIVLTVVSFGVFKMWESFNYSEIYQMRIEDQIKKIEEAKKKQQEAAQPPPPTLQ